MNILEITRSKRDRQNPELPPELGVILKKWQAMAMETLKQALDVKGAELVQKLAAEVEAKVSAQVIASGLIDELRRVIMSGVHIPANGHTPTNKELLKLIKPLVPDVRKLIRVNEAGIIAKLKKELKAPTPVAMKAREIVVKINSEEEGIEQSSIKGLRQTIKNIQRALAQKGGGGAGGGMGNWIHKQFALTAVTTSVTLAYSVAASGMAHIVRYQGQVMFYGTHYTISGKTVTLLFTPEASTVLDVTYVRT